MLSWLNTVKAFKKDRIKQKRRYPDWHNWSWPEHDDPKIDLDVLHFCQKIGFDLVGVFIYGVCLLLISSALDASENLCFLIMDFLNIPIYIITKTRLFKYIENFTSKNGKFSDKKKTPIFFISAQNIYCGYSLEPPCRGGSNEYPQSMFSSKNKKNNVYTCKPQLYYIKVDLKGSKLYRRVLVMFLQGTDLKRFLLISVSEHKRSTFWTFVSLCIHAGGSEWENQWLLYNYIENYKYLGSDEILKMPFY